MLSATSSRYRKHRLCDGGVGDKSAAVAVPWRIMGRKKTSTEVGVGVCEAVGDINSNIKYLEWLPAVPCNCISGISVQNRDSPINTTTAPVSNW